MAPLPHHHHKSSSRSTKPTAKRQQSRQLPILSAKTLHHNFLAFDFPVILPFNHTIPCPPVHIQHTNATRTTCPADAHSTLRGFLTCTALAALSIYEQAITKALLALPEQFQHFAGRAWMVPGLPTICFAALYTAAFLLLLGVTATAQVMRGTGTEA